LITVQAVEIYTSIALGNDRAALGVVIRDSDGQTLRVVGRTLGPASADVVAYRAVLHGVWTAKRLGVRRIRVLTEHPKIVAQLAGDAEVPADLIGLYLQTKAMLNAYRWSTVELIPREQNAAAALVAAEALEREPVAAADEDDLDPLPLWVSAERAAETVGHH
jgi:ribonuclease HI